LPGGVNTKLPIVNVINNVAKRKPIDISFCLENAIFADLMYIFYIH